MLKRLPASYEAVACTWPLKSILFPFQSAGDNQCLRCELPSPIERFSPFCGVFDDVQDVRKHDDVVIDKRSIRSVIRIPAMGFKSHLLQAGSILPAPTAIIENRRSWPDYAILQALPCGHRQVAPPNCSAMPCAIPIFRDCDSHLPSSSTR